MNHWILKPKTDQDRTLHPVRNPVWFVYPNTINPSLAGNFVVTNASVWHSVIAFILSLPMSKVLLIKRYFGACFSVCMQSIKLTFQQVGALAKWLDCPVASLSSLLQPWPAKPWGHSLRMEFRSLRSAGFNWKYEKIGDIILVEGGFCHDLTKIQVRFATTWQNHIFCESHWICISDVAFHSLFHHVSPDWEDSDGKARVLGSTSLKFLPFIHWSMVRWMNHND